MKTVEVHREVIYDVEEEWLKTFEGDSQDKDTPSIFWKFVKDMSGLDVWKYNARSEYFTCEVHNEKKAIMFLMRFT